MRSGPRAFYENRDGYFAELKAVGASDEEIAAIQRYGTPVLHQRIDTQATRAALGGVEGTGEIIGYRGVPTLASWGPLAISGVKWALVAKIDTAEAFAPIDQLAPGSADRRADWRCSWWSPPPPGFRARCSGRCASSPPG